MSAAYYPNHHSNQSDRFFLIALAISLLLHILILFFANIVPKATPVPEETMNVTYIEEPEPKKEVEEKSDVPGQIVETRKPLKEEKPMTERILSEFDSKGHFTEGKKSDRSESSKTSIPLNKPQGEEREQHKSVAQPVKKEIVKKIEEHPLGKGPSVQKEETKKTEAEKEENQKQVSPLFAKNAEEMKKGQKHGLQVNDQLPFLDGADLADIASTESGSEDLSDSDTVSLDTKNYLYFSYFNHIKRKIELAWVYPQEAGMRGMGGRLQLKFTLRKDGSLVKVVLLRSTGYDVLDEAAIAALQSASPYNPFPDTIKKEQINIVGTFIYNASFELRGR